MSTTTCVFVVSTVRHVWLTWAHDAGASRDIPRSPVRRPAFSRPPRVGPLERAVAGRGRVDPGRTSGGDVEVGLDHGYRGRALVAGDVHVPQARVEEAGAGPVYVRRARRVVAVVERERALGDDDEGGAGVGVPAGGAAGRDRGGQHDRVGRAC